MPSRRKFIKQGSRLITGGWVLSSVDASSVLQNNNTGLTGPVSPGNIPLANAITAENALPGSPPSEWEIFPYGPIGLNDPPLPDTPRSGDPTIQGFATEISVNIGDRVGFKINTDADAYTIKIYRLGYYQGNGARYVADATIIDALPQAQPAPVFEPETGLVDCGNWAESAFWLVPNDAVSGIYIAKLQRPDTGGASHIVFIVRDDSSTSDLLLQTSDATWQAYNKYGGANLYGGTPGVNDTEYTGDGAAGRAVKVSYNRPFTTADLSYHSWLFNAEYPLLKWLEKNGYDVTYTTNVDTARRGQLIQNHKVFISSGHDEYWSAEQRLHVESARDNGVHLAFFSGNEIYWKTRWEPSIDGTNTDFKTLVCYKDGSLGEYSCGFRCDPEPNSWTGLWRDGCNEPAAGGCNPENSLSGHISWAASFLKPIKVPYEYRELRLWRNTSIETLNPGEFKEFPQGTLGYEWDPERAEYESFYPLSRFHLSKTDETDAFFGNPVTHHLSLYRHASGALVFGAGTMQWSYGLEDYHHESYFFNPPDPDMQQATVNLLADMGVQPATLQAELVAATASTDFSPPVSAITFPESGAILLVGVPVTITGTATDSGGGVVAAVKVSVDGGQNWKMAEGTSNWSFTWTPNQSGSFDILSVAVDDSANLETSGNSPLHEIGVTVSGTLPVSFLQFYAVAFTKEIMLHWKTAYEKHNKGFEIHRSRNGIKWEKIGFVPGRGDSNQPVNYSYSDNDLQPGTYFYQLKQMDRDDRHTLSHIANATIGGQDIPDQLFQNYPNPFKTVTYISFTLSGTKRVSIEVFNLKGTRIKTVLNEVRTVGKHIVPLHTHDLPEGVYYYRMTAGSFTAIKKLVVQ